MEEFDTQKERLPKVSIIIPVYNVEKYLKQCLDSVVSQTLRDIEIIVANDGSTDGCMDIITEYAEKDGRIRVIDKPNAGYGQTMNVGMAAARGEYIGIVEADDFVEAEMFEILYNAAAGNEAEVAKSNFWLYWSDPERKKLHKYFSQEEDGKVITPRTYEGDSFFHRKPSIWSAIYKRKFLISNKIAFLETPGASFQDTSFTFKVYAAAERMVCLYDAFLYYRQDNESSSINNIDKKMYCVLDEYDEIERFLRTDGRKWKLAAIESAAFYDTCIWNYEKLGIKRKYPFLKRVSSRLERIIDEIGVEKLPFAGEWWKYRDIKRIADDPLEYHTWRFIERYEQEGATFKYAEPKTPLDNLSLIVSERAQDDSPRPFFSVIIPVYNVEKYLPSCLESVTFQTFEDIEIICVNDGSTDHSLSILEEYAAVDERFVIVNQENHGLAAARNAGAAAARGQYIIYVDSDDWIRETTAEILNKTIMKRENPDIVVFGTTPFPNEPRASDWHYRVLTTPDEYLPSIDAETLLAKPYLKIYIWRCCFKREFLTRNNISFDEKCKYGEDALFTFEAMPKASGVAVISDKLYQYRHFRQDSLMYSISLDPVSLCAEQIHILAELLRVSQRVGIPASKELAAYCLDFVFSCIDRCPEPEKTEYAVELYRLFKRFKLHVYIEELGRQYKGFWRECIEKARRDRRRRRFPFGVIASLSRFLFGIITSLSPRAFLRSVEALNQRLNSLEWQIKELKKWYADDNIGRVNASLEEFKRWYADDNIGRVNASLEEFKKWYTDDNVGKIYKRFEQTEAQAPRQFERERYNKGYK
ncbi:MAG: glycosyltransferase [Treponema sp.]|jgi:glycosyltransferase involved in cell wall biosynthesis|nr:glycosyltransferase [Treponema sp.]